MPTGSSNVLSAPTLEYLFHHMFLPPKLPGGDDTSVTHEADLIDYVLKSLSEYLQETELSCHRAIRAAMSMMENMKAGRDDEGFLREVVLRDTLRNILSSGQFSFSSRFAMLAVLTEGLYMSTRHCCTVAHQDAECGSIISTRQRCGNIRAV